MGFFSWKTSDTKKSIANQYSTRNVFTVHMITEDGKIFTEKAYKGYGDFGGKDIYELIAEINNLGIKNEDRKRDRAIELLFLNQITNGIKTYTAGGKDFFGWEIPLKEEGGKTPNQLVEEGWKQFYPNGYGDFKIAASKGIKLPKLVEKLPNKENWKKVWDSLPYPKNCSKQGYFY